MRRLFSILVTALFLVALGVTLWSVLGVGDRLPESNLPPPAPPAADGERPRVPEDDTGPTVRPPSVAPVPRPPTGPAPTLETARSLLGSERPTEALAALDRILEAKPGNAEALDLRGRAHRALGWHRKAERDFRSAVRVGGETAERLEDQAEALHRLRRDAEAEKLLRRARELEPGRARTHALLAVVLFQQGREKDAADEARAAQAIDPYEPLAKYVLERLE